GAEVLADIDRPAGNVFLRLLDNPQTLTHLGHADIVASETVTGPGAAYLEVEVAVGQVGFVLAQVASDAAGPSHRAAATAVDRLLASQNAVALGTVDENPIAVQQPLHPVQRPREVGDERPDLLDHQRRDVVHHAPYARVAVGEPRPAKRFENVVNPFALV